MDSNITQQSAFRNNRELLAPKEGINYERINYVSENRISRIKIILSEFVNFNDMFMHVEEILSRFSFSEDSDKFEGAIHKIGGLLGFISQRPDKEYKKGPDNLWCCAHNEYIMFECKNEVAANRTEINKSEASQFNTACAWFKQEYPEALCKNIMVIATKTLSYNSTFGCEVQIMRPIKAGLLKRNIKSFFLEFKNMELKDIPDEKVGALISFHKLDNISLKTLYSEDFFQVKTSRK